MPPSGFVPSEVSALVGVADSLLTRFTAEVDSGIHGSQAEGVEHEIAVIDSNLASDITFAERGVLLFVKQLYLALKAGESHEQIQAELRVLADKQYQ